MMRFKFKGLREDEIVMVVKGLLSRDDQDTFYGHGQASELLDFN